MVYNVRENTSFSLGGTDRNIDFTEKSLIKLC